MHTRYKVTMRETAMVGLNVALPSAPLGPRSSDTTHGIYREEEKGGRKGKESILYTSMQVTVSAAAV